MTKTILSIAQHRTSKLSLLYPRAQQRWIYIAFVFGILSLLTLCGQRLQAAEQSQGWYYGDVEKKIGLWIGPGGAAKIKGFVTVSGKLTVFNDVVEVAFKSAGDGSDQVERYFLKSKDLIITQYGLPLKREGIK